MAASTRIYEVRAKDGKGASRIVEAGSQAQAIKHCSPELEAEAIGSKRLAELYEAGVKVERANGAAE